MAGKGSFGTRLRARLERGWRWIGPVLRTRQLWLGLLVGGLLLAAIVLAFHYVVMPTYTRQGVEVVVPEVRQLSYEQAVQVVERRRLRAERRDQPFNPAFEQGAVLDQNPRPNASVKPGRRIYLYVNSGTERTVVMPELRTLTESVARSELSDLGLLTVTVRMDERPSPYPGTVTRQDPETGSTLRTSEPVTLWISPGLGDRTVEVPDVRGMSHTDAAAELAAANLWVDPVRAISGTITRQEPSAGSIVRIGTEVRLSSVPIEDPVVEPEEEPWEYEEGIPPFIEVPEGEEPPPDLDTPPREREPARDPDRVDW